MTEPMTHEAALALAGELMAMDHIDARKLLALIDARIAAALRAMVQRWKDRPAECLSDTLLAVAEQLTKATPPEAPPADAPPEPKYKVGDWHLMPDGGVYQIVRARWKDSHWYYEIMRYARDGTREDQEWLEELMAYDLPIPPRPDEALLAKAGKRLTGEVREPREGEQYVGPYRGIVCECTSDGTDTRVYGGRRWIAEDIPAVKPEAEPPKPTAEDYLRGHRACGIEVGNLVRVVRKASNFEGGWSLPWLADMDDLVDCKFVVQTDTGAEGFRVDGWAVPYFVLQPVADPAPAPGQVWGNQNNRYLLAEYRKRLGWIRLPHEQNTMLFTQEEMVSWLRAMGYHYLGEGEIVVKGAGA